MNSAQRNKRMHPVAVAPTSQPNSNAVTRKIPLHLSKSTKVRDIISISARNRLPGTVVYTTRTDSCLLSNGPRSNPSKFSTGHETKKKSIEASISIQNCVVISVLLSIQEVSSCLRSLLSLAYTPFVSLVLKLAENFVGFICISGAIIKLRFA